jgi:hypothetical protein
MDSSSGSASSSNEAPASTVAKADRG